MIRFIYILLISVFSFIAGCSQENPVNTTGNQQSSLVGMALILHKDSPAGIDGYLQSVDLMTSNGINLFGMAPEWPELEPSPGIYSLQDPLLNPLTMLDPEQSKFRSYILVIKVIDTFRKSVPEDLAEKPFDEAAVVERFKNLIDTLAVQGPIQRVSHILIGNEVDARFSANPDELNAFYTFFQQAVNRIHEKMSWMKVGTIITFNSLASHPDIFNTLIPLSDFVCYTYYPTDDSNPNWQMRSTEDVQSDMDIMAAKAGDRSFAFTETGYPSSIENNSSELKQKQFVEVMFNALKPYKDQGKLEFIYYHGMYDYPPGFCSLYAQQQGIDSTYLCGFMNNLGLRSFDSGVAKPAWDAFVERMKDW